MDNSIVRFIFEKHKIDLSKRYYCEDFLSQNTLTKDKYIVNYINAIFRTFINDSEWFSVQDTIKTVLHCDSLDIDVLKSQTDIIYNGNINDLGKFIIASKIYNKDGFNWYINLTDKFNNLIEYYIIDNKFISNYLDVIVYYCENADQTLPNKTINE